MEATETITPYERLENSIRLRETDRPTVLPSTRTFCLRYLGIKLSECSSDPQKYVDAQIRCFKEFGYDGVWTLPNLSALGEALGSDITVFEDNVPALSGPVLKQPGDLKRLKAPDDISQSPQIRYHTDIVAGLKKAVESQAMVISSGTSVFRLAGMLRGINDLYLDLALNPDFIIDLQEFCFQPCVDFALALHHAGAEIVSMTNPIANATCLSRQHYEQFVHPFTKRLFAAMRDAGIIIMYHTCGDWNDRFDLAIEEGPHILHVDKADLSELKRKYGKKVCLMGNVKSTETMLQGTPEDVRRESEECIKKAQEGGGFILSADCVLPRDTPPANVRAMVETAKKFGS